MVVGRCCDLDSREIGSPLPLFVTWILSSVLINGWLVLHQHLLPSAEQGRERFPKLSLWASVTNPREREGKELGLLL
ncbi:hypothetical protein EV2_040726 [Malus domestica]